MPPELVALNEGPSVLLDKPILLLGRHQECDIQLNSRKVSRRHCCIAQVRDYLVIRDLCSTNGIRINGHKVLEGQLKHGDEVTIGNFQFRVNWPGHSDSGGPDDKPWSEKHLPAMAVLTGSGGPGNPLESCDQPVPLPEASARADRDKLAHDRQAPSSGDKRSSMEDQPPSLILPENLELAPSDVSPKNG